MNAELEKIIDLSIVQSDIGIAGSADSGRKSAFWRLAAADENMAFGIRNLIEKVCADRPICRDIAPFADKIATRNAHDSTVAGKPVAFERPPEFDDYVAECTPQFILRNIPKVERYYDLDRPLPFVLDDMPIDEAIADIEDVRQAKLDPPEFSDHDNIDFLEDFRTFLEEIFVLCPWDQITRKAPDENSPWHLKNSATKLAHELLERKNTFFVFGTRGMTTMQMGDYRHEKEKKQETARPGGIGMPTFGPG